MISLLLTDKLDQRLGDKLAESENYSDGNFSSDFRGYINDWREIRKLEMRQRQLESRYLLRDPGNNTPLATFQIEQRQMMEEIGKIDDEIELRKNTLKLPTRSGPVCDNLDTVLKDNKISIKAWHSRSFVGNHCHKYMKGAFKSVCISVVTQVEKLTPDSSILASARDISDKFAVLNAMYAEVHTRVSLCRPMKTEEIYQAQSKIDKYMTYFRNTFPHISVIPKQHILEYHCTPFMHSWGF